MLHVVWFQCPASERFVVKLSCNAVLLTYKELPHLVQGCELPVIVSSEGKLIISGLCSVLRHIVHTAQLRDECFDSCDLASCLKNLLGLRQNCLRACAEVSEWTLYTEVTLPQLVERVFSGSDITGSDPPAELVQLENQLAKLSIEPNCRRQRKQSKAGQLSVTPISAKENTVEDRRNEWKDLFSESFKHSKCKNLLERSDNVPTASGTEEICQRPFVEGSNVQLTDLVLFVCIRLLFDIKGTKQWSSHLPRIISWYQRMAVIPSVHTTVFSAGLFECIAHTIGQGSVSTHPSPILSTASVSDETLTSIEDKCKLCHNSHICNSTLEENLNTEPIADDQGCIQNTEISKFRASQELIDSAVAKVTEMGLLPDVLPLGNGRCLQLPWEQYPSWVLPCGLGGVPDKRATRKLQQLENIAAAVKQLVSEQFTDSEAHVVVDFCSGSGHVGILLAHLFSNCQVDNFYFNIRVDTDIT